MAKLQSTGRQAARSAAEGAAQSVAKPAPAPREESTNTTETQAAEEAPAAPIALVVVAPNPKRKGSKAFGFYEKYGKPGVMTTHSAVLEAGVRGKDVSWDRDRRHILLDDDASNFPVDGSREEQAAYLQKLDPKIFTDAQLVKWGYKDAPKEEPAATETQTPATATA